MQLLKNSLTNLKDEVKNIEMIEQENIEKFLIRETRNIVVIECVAPKISKCIDRFNKKLLILGSPQKQHVYPHED